MQDSKKYAKITTHVLQEMKLKRDALLKKLGAALHDFPVAARLVETTVPSQQSKLTFRLNKDKLRQARKREGRYLLRTNITRGRTAQELWQFYIQLTKWKRLSRTSKTI